MLLARDLPFNFLCESRAFLSFSYLYFLHQTPSSQPVPGLPFQASPFLAVLLSGVAGERISRRPIYHMRLRIAGDTILTMLSPGVDAIPEDQQTDAILSRAI